MPRLRTLLALGALGAAISPLLRSKSLNTGGAPASRTWRAKITSHETFSHDSIDNLGYDWERIADPSIAPKYPLRVYLPQTTEELQAIVREARERGEKVMVRSKGHSSNDLVLDEHGSVIVTEKMNKILEIDRTRMVARVQAGAISAEIDDELSTQGLGLPIIGDHNHITVGGFASVGGISPASHRHGLFIDNVEALEYVTWDGDLRSCSRSERPDEFNAVLAGLGLQGIMATLTCRIVEIDKYGTVLENEATRYRDVDEFIASSESYINDPGDALYERGVWISFKVGGSALEVGQFSAYRPTEQTTLKKLRNRLAYGYLHRIGFLAGRLPPGVDRLLKYIGTIGVIFSPRYASIKNIEFFTDKILDSTAGDPTRMLIVLAPIDRYRDLFRDTYDLMVRYREEYGCFTFVSVYVKSIHSEYLSHGTDQKQFCELMYYMGINPQSMNDEILMKAVSEFDDICIRHGGYRYMHSKTVKDERREKVDPNAYYRQRAGS